DRAGRTSPDPRAQQLPGSLPRGAQQVRRRGAPGHAAARGRAERRPVHPVPVGRQPRHPAGRHPHLPHQPGAARGGGSGDRFGWAAARPHRRDLRRQDQCRRLLPHLPAARARAIPAADHHQGQPAAAARRPDLRRADRQGERPGLPAQHELRGPGLPHRADHRIVRLRRHDHRRGTRRRQGPPGHRGTPAGRRGRL
ncbi:MAG: hypothetical protein AVDCRST_MAG52-1374, partial [uncultured Blastococcus sp.]